MPIETFEPPYLGMNTEAQLNQLPKGQAILSQNFLPGYPGRCPLRGPMTVSSALPATGTPTAVWTYSDGQVLLSTNRTLTTVYRGYVGSIEFADFSQPNSTTVPAGQYAVVGNHVYGLGAGGRVDGSAGNVYLLDWDLNAATITNHVHAPRGGVGLAFWLNRLFVLGGNDPDVNNPRDFYLLWSDPIDGVDALLTDAATTWKDDVSGLVNKLAVADLQNPTALAVMGRHLAIFGKNSIHVVRGDAPSNWTVRKEIDGVGCIDARTIVTSEDGVYFASDTGYYFYDGASLACISNNVRSKFMDNRTFQRTAARLDRDHILVSFAVNNHGLMVADWSALVHLPTGSWTEVTLAGGYFGFVASTPDGGVWVSSSRIWSTADIANPMVGDNTAPIDFLDSDGTNKWIIAGRAKTRVARLGEPDMRATIRSIRLDAVLAGTADASTFWHVTLLDEDLTDDANFDYPTFMGFKGTPGAPAVPQRVRMDAIREVDEAGLDIRLDGPDGTAVFTRNRAAELHNAYLFYTPTRSSGSY